MNSSQKVISFGYVLTNSEGAVLDQSEPGAPMTFLQGLSQIVPGLEQELVKMAVGERKKVHVEPALGYGMTDPGLVFSVPRTQFPKDTSIELGMQFETKSPEGVSLVFVVSQVGLENIQMDGNHPLAGQDLYFDVEVVEIRDATSEEIAHGHVHHGHEH